jgi:hypothetical protein
MKKELTWEQHIERCLRKDMSKRAYCEENNLSYPLFFYYQRKLMEKYGPDGFQEIVLSDSLGSHSPDDHEDITVLQVQFANGSALLFSEHLLERVFHLLQEQS